MKKINGKKNRAKRLASAFDLQSEEDVKIQFLVPFLEAKGYKKDCIAFNKAIEVQEGRRHKTIYADAVVYTNPTKKTPLIVCETKSPDEVLGKSTKEQAISYARLLPRIAPIALITNGSQTQVFHTLSKHRIGELPDRKELKEDFLKFVLTPEEQNALRTEAKHDLFIIDDVQSFKSILKSCHDEIRNNEGYDPTVAFDEMAKVLFCKMFEERQNPSTNRFRVSVFDDTLKRLHVNVVKQIYEETKLHERYSGLFERDSPINLQDRTIRKIVSLFENYDLSLTAFDVKGEAFEYFLGETFTGGLGEFFTPRNVVEFMVDAVDPKIGSRIVDPFCGTGGFLIYAFEVVSEKIRLNEFDEEQKLKWKIELSNKSLYGTDWKERTSLACKMNMIVHGDGSAGIFKHHGLIDIPDVIEEGQFSLCITNPPFGSTENDPRVLTQYELGSGRNSQDRVVLAIERSLRLVKPGGTVAIVVIDGILNNDSTRYVRDFIRRNAWVHAVVSLPAVTFEGYHARAKTSILFLEKKQASDDGQQKRTFMAVAENSGYAPNGAQISGNELPDVLLDYRAYLRGDAPSVHKHSWIGAVADRLDAEYYRPGAAHKAGNAEATARLAGELAEHLRLSTEQLDTVEKVVKQVFADLDGVPLRVSQFLQEVSDPERVLPDRVYKQLGVRWWGGGTFVREENAGRNISAPRLNKVSGGWVIYNRLFAFRGSFAVVAPEHNNCYASNEFPTFKMREDVKEAQLVAQYIVHLFLSPQFLSQVDRDSTGSTKTSRNRYKSDRFLSMMLMFPKRIETLRNVVDLMNRASGLRFRQEQLTEQLKELSDSLARMLPHPVSQQQTSAAPAAVEFLPERSPEADSSVSEPKQNDAGKSKPLIGARKRKPSKRRSAAESSVS
ncbi:MAG: N-6 DNA methylase [Acidobacteriia bacterium]|nr:N-6 DNA methylase [Terriglobia bacterium]